MPTYTTGGVPSQYPVINLVNPDGTPAFPTTVQKVLAANLAVVNTVQTNLPDINWSVAANETWQFRAGIFYDSTTGNDFRMSITTPAGATLSWAGIGTHTTATSGAGSLNAFAQDGSGTLGGYGGGRAAAAAAVKLMLIVNGIVVVGATAGTVQLRAAKFNNTDTTSPADDMTVYANSHLIAWKA